jgi:hypothetical protein
MQNTMFSEKCIMFKTWAQFFVCVWRVTRKKNLKYYTLLAITYSCVRHKLFLQVIISYYEK